MILFRGGAVNLSARLVVGHQPLHADTSGQWRLAGTLRGFHVGHAEAPVSVNALPAEQGTYYEFLPGQQLEGLALEVAAVEFQDVGVEALRFFRFRDIPHQPALVPVFNVPQVTRALAAHMRACNALSRNNFERVLRSRVRNSGLLCLLASCHRVSL